MKYMNGFDIDIAAHRYADHLALGPAVQTLDNLKEWADTHSDGWAYWPKPCRSAAKLMDLIEGDGVVTAADVRKAYVPIKAFLTRQGVAHDEIVVPV